MSVIFPGNYVAHLNAYRDQGVVALPGVEFYRQVGAVVINPDNDSITTVDGVLEAGDYTPQILSPDLRQDDKPRKDKPMVIPAGAIVYRTARLRPGVKSAAAGDTITVKTPATPAAATPLTSEADLDSSLLKARLLPCCQSLTVLLVYADVTVAITTSADFTAEQNPSAGACRKAPSAILVEVCYYVPAPAPDYDDAHIPYGVEAGQGY